MSEIRVDSFKAEDGIGAPSFPNGIQVTGVVTATVLDATVPFLTVGSNAQLGNAGIVTATGIDINGNADVSGNLSVGGVLTYEDVKNVDAIGIVTARSGIKVTGGQLDVGSNIKAGNAGVITATAFHGSGANLTGLAGREVYGFTGVGKSLSLTTTNGGADNITNATYVAFEQSFIGPSGLSFSINTSGNLIMTV